MTCPLTPPYAYYSFFDNKSLTPKRRNSSDKLATPKRCCNNSYDRYIWKKLRASPPADSLNFDSSASEAEHCSRSRVSTTPISRHYVRRSFASQCDIAARRRCLEYLVSAIDEVWARYYTCSSFVENKHHVYDFPSPCELDDNSDDDDQLVDSAKLQALKERLTKAKYYLQDLSEVSDMDASSLFWNRWDLVKYAIIEFVEENGDDDDVIESVCGELEHGRV